MAPDAADAWASALCSQKSGAIMGLEAERAAAKVSGPMPTNPPADIASSPSHGLHRALGVVQGLLALTFGVSGSMKAFSPIAELAHKMAWPGAVPEALAGQPVSYESRRAEGSALQLRARGPGDFVAWGRFKKRPIRGR